MKVLSKSSSLPTTGALFRVVIVGARPGLGFPPLPLTADPDVLGQADRHRQAENEDDQPGSVLHHTAWVAGRQETKSWLGEDLGLGWERTRKMSTNSLKIGQLVERFPCILESVHKDLMKDKTRIYFLGLDIQYKTQSQITILIPRLNLSCNKSKLISLL